VTLDELNECWNELRNAALGRGVTPNVPPKLAKELGVEYERWKVALADANPLADAFASVSGRKWVESYRRFLKRVRKKGVEPKKTLAETPLEAVSTTVDKLSRNIAIGAGVAGVVLVTLILYRGIGGR